MCICPNKKLLRRVKSLHVFDKDASAFTSSPFDFVANGLQTIQFLLYQPLKQGDSGS
jgi:hypothetical protein